MRKTFFLATLTMFVLTSFGQRKTTTVKSYYRKDGTYVNSHTRYYNSGSALTKSNYSSGLSDEDNFEIYESSLSVSSISIPKSFKKLKGIKVEPTTLISDTNGMTMLIAVLRYNDTTVVDICPIPKSILTYDYETSTTSLYFKIPKDKIKSEDIIELVSKYRFELKDDYLLKSEYLGIGKIELPKYMTLKIEALTLK